jgi:hypothetical protein
MKLTPAQFATLHTLSEFGVKEAVEVLQSPDMAGRRKVKLQWNVASAPTLAALETAGLVAVERTEPIRPRDATGKRGLPRRMLKIEITDAGRAALAA